MGFAGKMETTLDAFFSEQLSGVHAAHGAAKNSIAAARQLHDVMTQVVGQAEGMIAGFAQKVEEFEQKVLKSMQGFEKSLMNMGQDVAVADHKKKVKERLLGPLKDVLAQAEAIVSDELVVAMATVCAAFCE